MTKGAYLHNHPRISRLSYDGRGLLGQSSIPAVSRGSLAQSSTYLQQLVMRGGAYLDNPQYFSNNFKGLSCAITYISPATSYEGRGSLVQASTYVMRGGAHLHNHSYKLREGGTSRRKRRGGGERGGGGSGRGGGEWEGI